MNVAIIPARGGSRRIPRKNVRNFHGKPIIAYSIEAAKASGLFSRIVVSTDDEDIADIGHDYGADALIRPAAMAEDAIGTQEVTAHALRSIPCRFACCIYPTAPLLRGCDLQLGLDMLRALSHTYRYVYVPGWYYWGAAESFIARPHIDPADSLCLQPEVARWTDINDEADWIRAEKMYAEIYEVSR